MSVGVSTVVDLSGHLDKATYDTGGRGIADGAEVKGVASDDLLAEDTAIVNCSAACSDATFLKVKELTITETLLKIITLRITWAHAQNGGTTTTTIYRNGAAVGTPKTSVSITPTYEEETDDVAGWDNGDKVQAYMNRGVAGIAYIKDFRVKGYIVTNTTPTLSAA